MAAYKQHLPTLRPFEGWLALCVHGWLLLKRPDNSSAYRALLRFLRKQTPYSRSCAGLPGTALSWLAEACGIWLRTFTEFANQVGLF